MLTRPIRHLRELPPSVASLLRQRTYSVTFRLRQCGVNFSCRPTIMVVSLESASRATDRDAGKYQWGQPHAPDRWRRFYLAVPVRGSPSVARASLPFAAGVSSAEPAKLAHPAAIKSRPLTASHSHRKRAQGGSMESIVRLPAMGCVPPFPNRHSRFVWTPFNRPIFVPVPTWCRHHLRRSGRSDTTY